jgi:hypothetical protein
MGDCYASSKFRPFQSSPLPWVCGITAHKRPFAWAARCLSSKLFSDRCPARDGSRSSAAPMSMRRNQAVPDASNAVLDFIDKTQLELGPTAKMKVDRVVFNTNRSVKTLMVNAESGPVRWISGESGYSAYEITTPNLIVTPQGTMFDLFVTPERTIVVLQEGRIRVCLVNAPQACRLLSQPREVIIGTRGGLEGPRAGGPTQSEFASRCLSAASQNERYASART